MVCEKKFLKKRKFMCCFLGGPFFKPGQSGQLLSYQENIKKILRRTRTSKYARIYTHMIFRTESGISHKVGGEV